ncbi:hypothetical protein CEXT_629201 [Caerostris extrusa]|uniref:Uncharacterized protein n=1 Tax=Caerostris extrusa TaxID=172846 RepID=A0AAV4XB08_CAEEX|nr:hypothetical protein CEXT_629201 [Caerostris extrusa]
MSGVLRPFLLTQRVDFPGIPSYSPSPMERLPSPEVTKLRSDPPGGALYLLARPVMLHGVRSRVLRYVEAPALAAPLIRFGSLRA